MNASKETWPTPSGRRVVTFGQLRKKSETVQQARNLETHILSNGVVKKKRVTTNTSSSWPSSSKCVGFPKKKNHSKLVAGGLNSWNTPVEEGQAECYTTQKNADKNRAPFTRTSVSMTNALLWYTF